MTTGTISYAEAKMAIYWDLEDCPVPDGLTPGMVYQNIRTALVNEGLYGPLSITVFANDTSVIPVDDFESAGIKLRLISEGPKGIVRSRDMALKTDMLFSFSICDHGRPSNMMVISEVIADSHLHALSGYGCNIFLAQPQKGPKIQILRDVTSIWFWESLSAGGKPIVKPATCPCCRRFKGDADALPEAPEAEEHSC